MPAKRKAVKTRPQLLEAGQCLALSREGFATESTFHMPSDAERGIFSVVYQCQNCEDTQTLRYFKDETVLQSTNCVKCRAGFGNNPGGMFPLVGDEAAPN